MRRTSWFMLLSCACAGGSPTAPDGAGPGTSDATSDTGSEITEPPVELACDDALDDDSDGDVDCADTDCSDEVHCGWPVVLDLRTEVAFDANLLAELGGYGDCEVVTLSALARDRDEDATCVECDRVFCGDFTYPVDDCPEEPGLERPTAGCFGFRFLSDAEWALLGRNPDTGVWYEIGVLTGTAPRSWSDTQPLEVSGAEVGSLTTSFEVSEP